MWGGVDVGGRRKGFHAAVVDERRLVAGPTRLATASAVLDWLEDRATLVAVDSPCAPAPDGSSSRPEERALAAAVCGIRYTPAASALVASAYYEWIEHGFELYATLDAAGLAAIECFPTASWTRWAGSRGTTTRAATGPRLPAAAAPQRARLLGRARSLIARSRAGPGVAQQRHEVYHDLYVRRRRHR